MTGELCPRCGMGAVEFSDNRKFRLMIFDILVAFGVLILLVALGSNALVAGGVALVVGTVFRVASNRVYYQWTRTADGRAFTWSNGRVVRAIPNEQVVCVTEGRSVGLGPFVVVHVDAEAADLLTSRVQRRRRQFVILHRQLQKSPALNAHLAHLGQRTEGDHTSALSSE